ncbi:hypothetical protein LMG26858_03701 [Achromobacter anxifer]|jgi:hypothetical protein|uniref:Uncharacterized protein n=1 Tax=Achromobacter anxifer TaxID=1287737 RepID=A0A6S7DEH5_9BURK|nr:hypothetical protein [Achromobacter anxifer]CAB3890455.1 hypothetical protein LMG26858_03701 [Achromobacter anxifer]CAB5511665.1 hypothetical protein LMG26857_00953 [Achromobacter anxifer]
MKPIINEYVHALNQPGYDAARRNAFVAAMVSKQLMRRTADRRRSNEVNPAARANAIGDNTEARAGKQEP